MLSLCYLLAYIGGLVLVGGLDCLDFGFVFPLYFALVFVALFSFGLLVGFLFCSYVLLLGYFFVWDARCATLLLIVGGNL